MKKLINKWNEMSESLRILIIIGLISIIGIIWRWKYIVYAVAKSFGRYKGYAD